MDIKKAIKLLNFYQKHSVMPELEMVLPKGEFAEAQKVVFHYINLLDSGKLYKKCNNCEEVKPMSDFALDQNKPKGFCKICNREYHRNYVVENSEKLKEHLVTYNIKKSTKLKK